MNIGKIPRLFRGAVAPSIQSGAGIYSIDYNEVSVTTPEATLMSLTLSTDLFNRVGVSVEIDSWFQLSSSNTLYLDIDGSLVHTLTVGGSVSLKHTLLLVRKGSDYLYGLRAEHIGAANSSVMSTFTPAGSSFVVRFRGTNVTQKLMRAKCYPT